MGKRKKKVRCKYCQTIGKTSFDHCFLCDKHHKLGDSCPIPPKIKPITKCFAKRDKNSDLLQTSKLCASSNVFNKKRYTTSKLSFFSSTICSPVSTATLNTSKETKVKFYFCYRSLKLIAISNPDDNSLS